MVEMLPTVTLLVLAVSVVARDNSSCDGPCGFQYRQGSSRIVGGQASTRGAWPWMVSLQVFTYHDSRRYHACGGVLLSDQWLLTAAHCFRLKKKAYDWRLVLGAREIEYGSNQPVKPPLQERFIEKIILHERYSPISEANDIALLKITPPVVCSDLIRPGCLPHFLAGPPRVSQACWVAGWGLLKENARKMSPVLQEALVDILDLSLCNSTLWYRGRVRSTNVCAGFPEGHIDTCQGDSGGPLMCRRSAEDPYVVVGITSWGVGCARAKRPGVYTATWPYLHWIASKIGSQALQMIQPGTPSPPTVGTGPSVRPSSRPPWYLQYPSQAPALRPPAPRPPPPPSPLPPPSPPPPTKPPEALSFAKRLQQLIETLKGKTFLSGRSNEDMEDEDLQELTPLSTDLANLSLLKGKQKGEVNK